MVAREIKKNIRIIQDMTFSCEFNSRIHVCDDNKICAIVFPEFSKICFISCEIFVTFKKKNDTVY